MTVQLWCHNYYRTGFSQWPGLVGHTNQPRIQTHPSFLYQARREREIVVRFKVYRKTLQFAYGRLWSRLRWSKLMSSSTTQPQLAHQMLANIRSVQPASCEQNFIRTVVQRRRLEMKYNGRLIQLAGQLAAGRVGFLPGAQLLTVEYNDDDDGDFHTQLYP